MTFVDLAERLSTMHDSQVIVVLERWTITEQMHLCANLREPLRVRGADIKKNNPSAKMLTVRKTNRAELNCHITTVANLGVTMRGFRPETTVFTIARSGIFESKAQ